MFLAFFLLSKSRNRIGYLKINKLCQKYLLIVVVKCDETMLYWKLAATIPLKKCLESFK